MTLEDAQKRVEELMIENKKLKNRIDFLEKHLYNDETCMYDYEDDVPEDYEYYND